LRGAEAAGLTGETWSLERLLENANQIKYAQLQILSGNSLKITAGSVPLIWLLTVTDGFKNLLGK